MSLDNRTLFYKRIIDQNQNIELDLLKSSMHKMNLNTVDSIRLTAAFENRPDLISYKYFGSYNYGWLISLHNEIQDPFTEYHIGRMIDIPSINDYYKFYNRNKFKLTPEPVVKDI